MPDVRFGAAVPLDRTTTMGALASTLPPAADPRGATWALRLHLPRAVYFRTLSGSVVIDASGHNHTAQRLTEIGNEVAALNMNALAAGLTSRGAALASKWRRLASEERWLGLSGQFFRFYKWNPCRG